MICKDNQRLIDNLLRLKQKDVICADIITKLMDQQSTNKIASVQSTKKIGEVAELQSLLNWHYR